MPNAPNDWLDFLYPVVQSFVGASDHKLKFDPMF